MDRGVFPALGHLAARYRWFVVVLWIILSAASIPHVPLVADALKAPDIEVPDRESGRASEILKREFGRAPARTAIAVFTSPTLTLAAPAYRDAVVNALQRVRDLKGIQSTLSYFDRGNPRFVGSDERTSYAVITFSGTAEQAKDLVPEVRDALRTAPDEPTAYLTGFPAVAQDVQENSQDDVARVELVSVPFTLLILLIVFGTPIAAGLPVVLGSVAIVFTLMLLHLAAQRIDMLIFAMNTSTMLGLALGIDFSLLMVSRFREELVGGLAPHEAAVRTVATAGQSIFFSGLTVVLGLSVLLVYDLPSIRSIAIAMMLVAAVAVLAAVTLLPALLTIFGRRVNAYSVFRARASAARPRAGAGRWHAWSMAVMRHPWFFLIASLLVLGALAWPAREMRPFGAGGFRGISKDAESRHGYEALIRAFPPGESSPMSIVIATNRAGGAWDESIRTGVARLVEALQADSRVARVDSVATLPPELAEPLRGASLDAVKTSPGLAGAVGQFVNLNGQGDVQFLNVIGRHDELAIENVNLVKELRQDLVPSIPELGGSEVLVTGQTALMLDYKDKLYGQLPVVVALVLVVTYGILLVFFHSLLLPFKAILLNAVSIAASYGVMVMVFQWGIIDQLIGLDHLGHVSLIPPVILFAILFGLSTDYEVFLLSRVKELYRAGHSNEASVAEGLERTAGLITAAGLIMLIVFGAFALAEIVVMKEVGVGVAVAVLIDATIIRVILVPATMTLMGRANWWMPRFLNWVPEISEGAPVGPEWAGRPLARPVVACSTCGRPLTIRGKFCGHCGSWLGQLAAPATPPVPGQSFELQWRPTSAGHPSGTRPLGSRLVPVRLTIGGVRARAWVHLRDCQVEMDPSADGMPSIAIQGMQIDPLAEGGSPEIQVVNARVTL